MQVMLDGGLAIAAVGGDRAGLLSALRRVEKRTRLRAEWTGGGTTYRFFDYVPNVKSERPA